MSPCAPFPLGRERLLENRHSNCAHPRTDSNYRSRAVSVSIYFPSDHTSLEVHIFSPTAKQTRDTFKFQTACSEDSSSQNERAQERRAISNVVSVFWSGDGFTQSWPAREGDTLSEDAPTKGVSV